MRRYTSRRKKALRNLAIGTVIIAIGFLGTRLFSSKNQEQDIVVAEVGKEKIFKSEINNKLQSIFADEQQLVSVPKAESLPKEVLEIVVKEIIIDRELIKLAKKLGFDKDPKIIEKVAIYKDRVLKQSYIDSIIDKEITKEKISEKYSEISNAISGKKEYQISHIVVKSKEDADKVITELKSKKAPKFADLAKKYSIEQQSAQSGGDLGFILEDNITKEISDELINLKKDEISSPIKTKFGWHIIKLSDLRDAKTLSFEESKDKIREQLIQNKMNEINSSFVQNNEIKFLISFEKKQSEEKPNNKVEDKSSEAVSSSKEALDSDKPEVKSTDTLPVSGSNIDSTKEESVQLDNKKDLNSKNTQETSSQTKHDNKMDKVRDKSKNETKKEDSSDNSKATKIIDKNKTEDKVKDEKKDDKLKSDKKSKEEAKNKTSKN